MDFRTVLIAVLLFLVAAMAVMLAMVQYPPADGGPVPFPGGPGSGAVPPQSAEAPQSGNYMRVYYLTHDQNQLHAERRLIVNTGPISARVERAMEAFLDGPKSSNLVSPVPSGTQLQSVFWSEQNRCVYISFSEEILKNHPGHALAEWGTIYAIVNTAAGQSPAVERVHILVDGREIANPNTLMDWSKPFEPDATFVLRTADGEAGGE